MKDTKFLKYNDLVSKIQDLYDKYYGDSEVKHIEIGVAFETVAAYFLEKRFGLKDITMDAIHILESIKGIDLESIKGIDLVLSQDDGRRWCVAQVAEHYGSGEELSRGTIEEFIRGSQELNIEADKRYLVLLGCPLSDEEWEDFSDEIGHIITDNNMREVFDWEPCWRVIKDVVEHGGEY